MVFDQEALIRSIAVSRSPQHMLLLGAGASASSGIPTAGQCVWEWKREVYLSGNPLIAPGLFLDVTLPTVQSKIQGWIDSQSQFPSRGHPDEYGFYIEYAYPRGDDRRSFFERRFSGAVPQIGYQLLAMLQNSFTLQWVWTTNFDGLLRQARKPAYTRQLKEIGLDTPFRLRDASDSEDSGYLVYLHGDYRYDRLQNTAQETRSLDDELLQHLVARLKRQPLVVVGYGGRDESVMSALEKTFAEGSAGGGLYWCTIRNEEVSSRVRQLVERASANGYEAHLIDIEGFDDLMVRLARFVYRDGQAVSEVEALLGAAVPERSAFRFPAYRKDESWLKSNGYPIELPRELYQFEASGISGWEDLRQLVKGTPVIAGLLKGKVLAMGDPSSITTVFSGRLTTKIELVPLGEKDYGWPDTVAMSILLEGLQRAAAEATKLTVKGRAILWDPSGAEIANYRGERHRTFPAIRIRISRIGGSPFLNLVPDLHVVREDGSDAAKEAVQEVKRQLLGRQWNKPYYDALEGWRKRLLQSEKVRTFSYPLGVQNGFQFRVSAPPAYARMLLRSLDHGKTAAPKAGEIFEAAVLDEPSLVFGSAKGHPSPKDPHPIRGLVRDGPYDLQLTQLGLCREIRLGVVCSSEWSKPFSDYLSKLLLPHAGVETKREYLQAYPGFQQAYRIPLRIPAPGDQEWRDLPGLALREEDRASGQREITSAVTRQVDALTSIASVDVVLVFVPQTWGSFELVEDESVSLNLHDFVKAYCAQKGIHTQLLRERTLDKPQQCEVLWWLAQAIYVKSLRTPFVLDTEDRDTVFVGIGYGYSKQQVGRGLVLGCSHIYDAAGQGMRYQLSRIQNPVWRHRNPYLTKDDAIRVGLQTRQLFYETYQRLPRRVVVHKRTPFLKSERDGLAQALQGVTELEMLTIEIEDAWRFIAYDKWKKAVDPFPVKRGTVLLLGPHEFFLWVHGTTRGVVENNKSYYQGKSRIPVPLKVTRHAGHSDVERVANELLGLSKMDWNSYDLYSQMPATLESSGAIARVGQLLARFGPETLDYRLFM